MTTAFHFTRARRIAALCLASAALHLLAIGWVGGHLEPGLGQAPQADAEAAPIVARLHAPAAVPVMLSAPSVPKPARRARPRPAAPPAPVAAESESGAAGQRGAAEEAGDVQSAQQEEAVAVAAAVAPEAAPEPLPEPAPVQAAEPEAPPPAAEKHYKVSLPPSARLTLDVARTDKDGARWSGVAVMSWAQDGSAYTLKVEAGISVIVTRVNLAVLTSEGVIDEAGIAPRTATEKRRGRAQTATHFDRDQARITFSASQASFPLLPGAQDKASFPLQLAGIARADPGQLDGEVTMLVGEDRDASLFRFVLLGQEEIDTGLGRMQAWRLSRPPLAGAYNSRLEVWLAPAYQWYPVQIRNTEANGAVTTQTISKIELTTSGK